MNKELIAENTRKQFARMTDEEKRIRNKKISDSMKGKVRTLTHRNSLSKSLKNRIITDETKTKMSNSWKYEKHFTPETKLKISKTLKTKCHLTGKYGKDHPGWKGGLSLLNKRIRTLPEYKEWRSSVYKRDNFKCVTCNGSSHLEAHHKIPLMFLCYLNQIKTTESAKKCNDLWNIDNGKTLCFDCHKKEDICRGKFKIYKKWVE